jgi:hypothetical protein
MMVSKGTKLSGEAAISTASGMSQDTPEDNWALGKPQPFWL